MQIGRPLVLVRSRTRSIDRFKMLLTTAVAAIHPGLYPARANQQLCPQGGAQYNLGCKCDSGEHQPPLCLSANGADNTLYDWEELDPTIAMGHSSFVAWCQDVCICIDEETAAEFQAKTPTQQAAQRLDGLDDWEVEFLQSIGRDPDAGKPGYNAPTNMTTAGAPTSDSQCTAGTCSVGSACGSENCTCQVTAAQYVPGAGTTKYTAQCGARFQFVGATSNPFGALGGGSSRRLMSRDKHDAVYCPCNTTYISQKCCDAKDGLVWESSEFKLGELVDDWDL